MSNCKLLATCPFYNGTMQDALSADDREHYCHGAYTLCGRYMSFLRMWQREHEAELRTSQEEKVYVTSINT